MQKHNFMLPLFLLLSERPACYGSTTEPVEEEYSGHGSTSLPVTTEVPVPNILGTPTSVMIFTTSDQGVQTATTFTEAENSETTASAEIEDLHPALIYGVPAALLLVLIVLLVVFIVRRRKQKPPKQEELASESCKSPIFEEDTPSVMEIEMEELDKWMSSLKRNTECEYLPPVKEEKDCNASPRSEIQSKELAFNFLSGNDANTSHRFEHMRATEMGNRAINECSKDIISNIQELLEDLEQGNSARI